LRVANKALIGIVPRSQAIGIGVELRKHGIKFAHSRNRRSIRHIGALIAGGLQLSGADNSFFKRSQFILIHRGSVGGIAADERRVGNGNALLLKSTPGVLKAASNSRIPLRKCAARNKEQRTRQRYACKSLSCFHTDSVDL
jgi:hypothetical protein